jgi:hypothetical protein
VQLEMIACCPGILNALVTWFVLDLDGISSLDSAPQPKATARPFWSRARGQQVRTLPD